MPETQIRTQPALHGHYQLTPSARTLTGVNIHTRKESEQLWLHIHLPQFSLEILTRGGLPRVVPRIFLK